MKILIVASLYPPYVKGGGEISTQLLAEGLQAEGFDVVVLSIGKNYSEKIINGIKVFRIPSKNIYWSYESDIQPKIKKLVWHLINSCNFNIKNDFVNILEREKPDIVHSSTIEDISPYIWKICKEKKIPTVHTLRSYTLLCPQATMYKNNKNCDTQCMNCKLITYPKKILSSNVTAVVGISNFILNKHLEIGYFKNAKTTVIYNPYLELQIKNNNMMNEITLGFVGRLEKNKGIEYILERYITSDFKNKLLIFGSTNDANYKKELHAKYQDERIIFVGQKKPEEIYSSISHLIVPSLWHEPFGRIVVEAYSQGIPVLGSNRGGIPDIIQEKQTGLIFSIEKDDFLEQLNNFLNMDFDTNIIREYASHFNYREIARQYIRVYEDIRENYEKF